MSNANGLATVKPAWPAEVQEKALAIIQGQAPTSFVGLANGARVALAVAESGEGISLADLTRVRTPAGGATTWEIDDGLGSPETTPALEGVMVHIQPRLVLWGREGEAVEGSVPILVSNDLRWGVRVREGDPNEDLGDLDAVILEKARDPRTGLYDMRDPKVGGVLPYCAWGSGRNSEGKRVKEQRVVALLREQDNAPLLVTIQPGSLKDFLGFVRKLQLRGLPYWQPVVRLSLTKEKNGAGQAYSKIKPELVKELSLPEAMALRQTFGVGMIARSFERAGYEAPAEALQAVPASGATEEVPF